MEFAIWLGDKRTIIYKKGEGIILNEASCIAYSRPRRKGEKIKIAAVGNAAKKLAVKDDSDILAEFPISGGRVINTELAGSLFNEIFKKVAGTTNRNCLFAIPCSLTRAEFNAFKEVAYGAALADVEFVPGVISNAIAHTENNLNLLDGVLLSVVINETAADIAVIKAGEIIHGGTLMGDEFNPVSKLREYVRTKYKLDIDLRSAEQAFAETATLLLNDKTEYKIRGIDIEDSFGREICFTGEDCYKIVQPVYKKITNAIKQVIDDCKSEETDQIKQAGIFIGGQGIGITGLREFLTAELGLDIVLNEPSRNSVINGTGFLLSYPEFMKKIIKSN